MIKRGPRPPKISTTTTNDKAEVQVNRKAMMRLFPKQLSKVAHSPSKSVDLDYSMLSKTTGPQLLEITRNSWLTRSANSPM